MRRKHMSKSLNIEIYIMPLGVCFREEKATSFSHSLQEASAAASEGSEAKGRQQESHFSSCVAGSCSLASPPVSQPESLVRE